MSVVEGKLGELGREVRIALCREVMNSLSDLVEGRAPAELCQRVDEYLEGCQPYRAYRDTLEATIRLAREAGDSRGPANDRDARAFEECVERVRARLVAGEERDTTPE